MPSPEYYRRQSELCLQLALLHDDVQTTYRLIELAKDFQAKAEQAQGELPSYIMPGAELQGVGGIDRD